ncbi:fimbrial biogenesis chaperone [Pseudomonas aeruginosa]
MMRFSRLGIALAMSVLCQSAFAGISLNSTRVIIEGGKKEASFGVRNMGEDILIQSWLEADGSKEAVKHFTLTPQLARVKADGEQVVRILYEGVGAAPDKESMFWLNVQEIPQRKPDGSSMQIAVLQRIKVFYRPASIQGKSLDAMRNLEWSFSGGEIQVNNPSAYHITLVNVSVDGKRLGDSVVVSPGEKRGVSAQSSSVKASAQSTVTYSTVNDYGAQDAHRVVLAGESPKKGEYQTAPPRTANKER